MKAVILARVSTEEQKEAGNSLPAQIERVKNYCNRKGFAIAKTYSFDESAYKTKRDEFDQALDFLKTTNEKIAICFDKVDRLSRNVFDKRVSLLYDKALKDEIELHFVSDGQLINSQISATEKFQFGMSLGLAKYYSDSISDNVRRAFEAKLMRGEWLGKAPIGYKNTTDIKGNKTIELDPKTAGYVQRLFELYASGNYSIRTTSETLAKEGLLNSVGNPLTNNMMNNILTNPFYYGEMLLKGKTYPHKYERLISKNLFDQCEKVRKGWHKKPFKYAAKPFTFRGLVRCAQCGGTVTPECAKGKFIYYSCTNYRKQCKRLYVPEKHLLEPVYEALKGIQLPDTVIDDVTEALRATGKQEAAFHKQSMEALRREYDQIEARIMKMYDDKLDGSITEEMYDKKLTEYKERQSDLHTKMQAHSEADEKFYITANTVLNLSKRAFEIFESSETSEKRQLLNYLLQNCELKGKEFSFELKTPFNLIYEYNFGQRESRALNPAYPTWLRGWDSDRKIGVERFCESLRFFRQGQPRSGPRSLARRRLESPLIVTSWATGGQRFP